MDDATPGKTHKPKPTATLKTGVRGITLLDLWAKGRRDGLRWRYRVYDAARHSYKTEDFAPKERAAGLRWAKRVKGRFDNGLDQSGAVSVATLADEVVAAAKARGCDDDYVDYMRQTYDLAIAPGITDLKAPTVAKRAEDMLAGLRDKRSLRNNDESKREGREVSASTLNLRITHLRMLGKHAVKHRILLLNPFDRLERRATGDTQKAVFLLPELRSMVRKGASDPWYTYALIAIYTGMRMREVSELTWRDFLWAERRIQVREGKGAKDRVVFIQPELEAYLNPLAKPAGYVFPDRYREASNKWYSNNLRRFLRACGLTQGDRTIHSFRHTWTALSLALGENQFQVISWLGHSDANITKRYAREQDLFVEATRQWPRDREFYLRRDPPTLDMKTKGPRPATGAQGPKKPQSSAETSDTG